MAFKPGEVPEGSSPYPPGVTGNPNGRPRKYISTLKEQGYKTTEVNDCIQVLVSMTVEEIDEVLANDNATVLEKIVAGAIKRDIKKKSLYSLETLLSRVHGRPAQTVDVTSKGEAISRVTNILITAAPDLIPIKELE